jgi:hypothetical protein
LKDSIDLRRKLLVRRGNYAYRMWVKYDAHRSWKEGRPGAVFDNGGGYHTLPWWGIGARKHRNKAIDKFGREMPFLGWDEDLYREYYSNHSVFPVDGDNGDDVAKAKRTSYSQAGSMRSVVAKKARRKVAYFLRSFTACRKA